MPLLGHERQYGRQKTDRCGCKEEQEDDCRGKSVHLMGSLLVREFWCGLTPELSRAAARLGGVVHVTAQAEPRSGLGLNELLGWGQLLSDATICDQAHAEFTSAGTFIRCAFADRKRVPWKSAKGPNDSRAREPAKANALPIQRTLWRKSVLAQPNA